MRPNIRQARDDEVVRLARTIMRAFEHDLVIRWLVPDDDDFENSHLGLLADMIRLWLATETIWVTDDIVGFAGWQRPGRPEVDLGEVDRLPGEEITHPPDRIERFGAFRSTVAEYVPKEEHWYLSLLGTHPDWQRQGIGLALMSEGFKLADEQGLPCYLETETVENVAYYQHHGFAVRSEWDIPLDGPHMWGMMRPPAAG